MLRYVDNLRELDERREGLDFEIHDILEDINPQASFEGQEGIPPEQFAPDSKVSQLIKKVQLRQIEIQEQKSKLLEIMDAEGKSIVNRENRLASIE